MEKFSRPYFLTLCGAILLAAGTNATAQDTRQAFANLGKAEVGTTSAMPKPDTVINQSNANGFAQLLSPSMMWVVRNGAHLKVTSYRGASLPKAILTATSKYAESVRMTPSYALENYVAGLPFARIDPNDPEAAIKRMLNHEAANSVDDIDVLGIECDTGTIGRKGGSVSVERHFLLYNYSRLAFVGRVYVDPKPQLNPNRDSVRYKEAIRLLEPFDLKGTGMVGLRYLADDKPLDTWLYLPNSRRVRRISAAQRSQAVLGQDIDFDSLGGFAAEASSFEWKLLGEQSLLGPFHGDRSPVRWSAAPADFLPDIGWEPRPVWVIEGKPVIPDYGYSKRVIYLDRETYRIVSSDLYDLAGELWKTWISSFLFDGVPDGGSYFSAATVVDVRSGHVTSCAIPGDHAGMGARHVNEGGETCEARFELTPTMFEPDPCTRRHLR